MDMVELAYLSYLECRVAAGHHISRSQRRELEILLAALAAQEERYNAAAHNLDPNQGILDGLWDDE